MKLKIFTFVTGLLIALCAQAQTSGPAGPLTWSYDPDTKTLSITGTGDMPDYSDTTPQPWKAYRSEIQTVTIGEGVTKIGVEAFINCSKLQNITISSSVTTIGDVAFGACQNLQSVTIPANVNVIGENSFVGSGLVTIHVDLNNAIFTAEDGVLYNKSKTTLICYPAGKTTPTFTISASVTTIGSYAFDGCTNLKEITVMWDTPLPVFPSIFSGVPLSAATLKVPAGKVADYQAAPVWKDFGTITDGTAVTGTAGPLTWSYDAGTKTLSITGTGEMPDYSNASPQPWQAYQDEIQTVTIGEGVTKIGQGAFWRCTALQNITIPSSVTTIGNYAFMRCDALPSITIPATVTSIGDESFNRCKKLTAITVDESNPTYKSIAGVLFTKDGTMLIQYPMGKTETEYTIPAGVNTIGRGAFEANNKLNKVTIPVSVNNIGKYAFGWCHTLSEVTVFWETPIHIENYTFYNISNGSTLYVPNGKTQVYLQDSEWSKFDLITDGTVTVENLFRKDGLFYKRTSSNTVSVVPELGNNATNSYYSTEANKPSGDISIPEQVTHQGTPYTVNRIERGAFSANCNVPSISIPKTVTTIMGQLSPYTIHSIHVADENPSYKSIDGVLYTKSGRTLVYYPRGKSDVSFTIPAGVDSLSYDAFFNAQYLRSVEIPAHVVDIERDAFAACNRLSSVTVHWPTPLDISGKDVFRDLSPNAILKVPAGKVADYQAAPVWKDFGTITDGTAVTGTAGPLTWSYDSGTKTLSINGTGAMPNYIHDTQPWKAYQDEIQTVTIGNGVSAIGFYAFSGFGVLQNVTISSSVTTIGNWAFEDCPMLQNITLPSGVTTIGYGVFSMCPALTVINVDLANAHYESENGVLYTKGKTKLIRYLEGKPGTSFTVPASVTIIGNGAFVNCQALQNITLPAGVTTIELGNFNVSPALTAINVDPANTHYESENGVLYNKGKTELIRYPQGKAGTAFTVPDEVTTIGDGTFSSCLKLQNITLPTGLTTIERWAFFGCIGLQKITIPANVTAIDRYAFEYCDNLKEVTVQWNNPLSVNPDIFSGVSLSAATLKVPAGKKALYQAAPVWKDFGTITESSVTPGTAELTVTPATARMMQVADDLYLSIQSNTDWTATSSEEWLTLSPSSGTKNGTVKATTTTNNDSQDRTATVTVKAGNQTRTVTITQKGRKAPSSVDLNISEVQLMVGAQIQLSDTVRPWNEDVDREVIWSSSNTRVATVDDTGLVRAVGEGEAVITVQTEIGGFKATCNVTVSKQDAIVIPPPPALPVPDTDKKNVVTLSLTVPTDQGFTLSFVLNLPKGLVLDQEKTKLAESLIEQYTLTITPEGNGWKFEIKPNMLRKAADQFVVREMVHVAYTADPSVEKGNYDAQIKKLHLTFTDGSTLAKNEIPFKITVHTTTSNELIEANRQVWTAGGRLYVTSPVRETVEVYTFGGKLVFRTVKPAGEAVYDLVMPEGAAIVRGSSGWTKKVKK